MLGVSNLQDFVIEDGCLKKYKGSDAFVSIPNGVTSIGEEAFKDKYVRKVDIPSGVTSIHQHAFMNCHALNSVSLPESLDSIDDGAFEHCFSLESVCLPESLRIMGRGVFFGCCNLNSLRLPAGLQSLGSNCFGRCDKLNDLTVDPENTILKQEGPLVIFLEKILVFCQRNYKGNLEIPDSITLIYGFAFDGCKNITEVTWPKELSYIGTCAFCNCDGLTSLHVPETVNVIESGAFIGCSDLEDITLPQNLQVFGSVMFGWCEKLRRLPLPKDITILGESMFKESHTLESISLPPGLETVEKEVFKNCRKLKELNFPASLKLIDKTALDGCRLERLTYQGEVPGLELNKNVYNISRHGELIADWFPFYRLSAKNKKLAARGIASRLREGSYISERVLMSVLPYLHENCVKLWKEPVFRPALLKCGMLSLKDFLEIFDSGLKKNNDPALCAQMLEYQHRNFTQEELDEMKRALCDLEAD